jgi:hypothetical protein
VVITNVVRLLIMANSDTSSPLLPSSILSRDESWEPLKCFHLETVSGKVELR